MDQSYDFLCTPVSCSVQMSHGEPRVPFQPLKDDSQIFCALQNCVFLSPAGSAAFMFHLCLGLQRSDGVLQPGPQLWPCLPFLGVPACPSVRCCGTSVWAVMMRLLAHPRAHEAS